MVNNQVKNGYLESAKNTINTEIEGLKALLDFFGDNFVNAVDLIAKIKGRVIISGMGKSGHIAGKIAATLASTGTPAFSIHPGEASHGDLGMITKDDVVILLSNSGETKELKDIIYYCKRFSIPLISMIRNPNSELAVSSDVPLILPNVPEANKVKAPTTSTTMMLALGDAIAVALLDAKGFSDDDFNVFHPGGKLGAQFIKVKNLMRVEKQLPLISNKSSIQEILIEMTSKHLGCAGVIDQNHKLIGIITDGDLRRHISQDLMKMDALNLMTKNPIVVEPDMLAVEAIAIMNKKSITSLFVVKNKADKDDLNVVGILHIHDCLRAGVV